MSLTVHHTTRTMTLTDESGRSMVLTSQPPSSMTLARQGARGPKGDPGDGDIRVVAAEALGGHRAVRFDGVYAEPTSEGVHHYAGVYLQAAVHGATARLRRVGVVEESSWAWLPDAPVFFGLDGVLTQTAPPGFVRIVGWALTPTAISLSPQSSIQL